MKSTARRHHYLPQAYLSAFTNTNKKDGRFFVLNIKDGISFRTSPLNVAIERDFNKVDIEGQPSDAIEQVLSQFEEKAVQAIRKTIEKETFPNDQDYNLILNILGLIAIRNPLSRKLFNRARESVLNRLADQLVSNREAWNYGTKKSKVTDQEIEHTVSFEQMKHFVEERHYHIEFSPEENLRIEFQVFNELLPILGKRTWSLFLAPTEGPDFICSDHPVTLAWKNESDAPVGYELMGTEVFFPLGRRVGFYGTFEKELPPVVKLKPLKVAAMNGRVALNADQHVFSALEKFFILYQGEIREVYC